MQDENQLSYWTQRIHNAEMHFIKTSRSIRVGLLVVSLIFTVLYWTYSPCKGKNSDICRHDNGVKVSEITSFSIRFFLVLSLILQTLKIFNIPIYPTIAGVSVGAATIGYIFSNQLFDFIAGMSLLLGRDISVGDKVVLHLSSYEKTEPLRIVNFRTLHLECITLKKDTVHYFVPYTNILTFEKL